MNKKSKFLKVAAMGLLALGTVVAATPDSSADGMVKCYGVAKKGKNDCTHALGKHGCAGQSTKDYDPCEWKAMQKSECNKRGGNPAPVNCRRK
jgi:uncharacterized membrane protein